MPRDQASALVTLGLAILTHRDGPDPGGHIAAALAEAAETRTKRVNGAAQKVRMAEGAGRAAKARAEQRRTAGAAPAYRA